MENNYFKFFLRFQIIELKMKNNLKSIKYNYYEYDRRY